MSEIETIESAELCHVVGAADQQRASYTWGDWVRGGAGALLGTLTGGPIGGVVGFGAGFMSRNVTELGNAVDDLNRERQRGQQLDQRRQQMQQPQPQRKQ
jgi:hypothetical protein